MDKLRLLVETYYDYQKGRIAYYNRLNRLPEEVKKMIEKETMFEEISNNLNKLEKSLIKAIENEVNKEELYRKVLSRIKGIGPVMGADIIAWFCKPRDFVIAKSHPNFEEIKKLPYAKIEEINNKQVRVILPAVLDIAVYPSDFYKYCGLIPGCKKKRGEQINYNPKAKTLFWKLVRQVLMAKSFYSQMYKIMKAKFQEKYKNEEKGSAKLKADLTARKKVGRHLALTIYLAYKFLNKQKAYLPYPIEVLGHEVDPPFVDGENDKPEYLEFLVKYAKK